MSITGPPLGMLLQFLPRTKRPLMSTPRCLIPIIIITSSPAMRWPTADPGTDFCAYATTIIILRLVVTLVEDTTISLKQTVCPVRSLQGRNAVQGGRISSGWSLSPSLSFFFFFFFKKKKRPEFILTSRKHCLSLVIFPTFEEATFHSFVSGFSSSFSWYLAVNTS